MNKLATRLLPLQAQYVRPLADAAEQRDWVPTAIGQALRRLDGTCATARPSAADPPRVKVRHPVFARLYAGQVEKAERLGIAERREALLSSLSGRVIEVGAGTGTNFSHYPETVTEVLALEPEPFLCRRAEEAAKSAPVPVRVIDATAENLPFEDGSYDAGVASFVMCSVANPTRALHELFRVVRPGGELRFNEHVRSSSGRVARIQRTADRLGWPRVSGGCHLGRDTEATITAAGFEIESIERYRFGIPPLDPPKPHIIGRARRMEHAA